MNSTIISKTDDRKMRVCVPAGILLKAQNTGAIGNARYVVNIRQPSSFAGSQHKQVVRMILLFNFSLSMGRMRFNIVAYIPPN